MSSPLHPYGTRPDLPDHRDGFFEAPKRILARLPARVDLRPRCPPIYNQGPLNSCTANALAAAMWFEALKTDPAALAPSRLFIYYNERSAERQPRCNVPCSLRDGHRAVEMFGACPEPQWRYVIDNFSVRAPKRCYSEGLNHRVATYLRVPRELRHMKACLSQARPFTLGMSVYSSFESSGVKRSGIAPMPKPGEQVVGGHAVMVVGYDERQACFIVRNSWGTRWGQTGYFLLPYAYVMSEKEYAWDFWTITELAAIDARTRRGRR